MHPSEPMIVLKNIGKIFTMAEIETHAISRINLTLYRGEYISIASPSECGRSTLLSIMGLLAPTHGTYLLHGCGVSQLPASKSALIHNTDIGFIFQNFNLIGDLSVYENVELPLCYRRLPSLTKRKLVLEALEKAGLSHRKNYFPSQLSGGQQQRVAVARAVVERPSILLADEPTGNLDSQNSEVIMDLIRHFHSERTTVCLVTHDVRYALHAGRIVHILDGQIISDERIREAA